MQPRHLTRLSGHCLFTFLMSRIPPWSGEAPHSLSETRVEHPGRRCMILVHALTSRASIFCRPYSSTLRGSRSVQMRVEHPGRAKYTAMDGSSHNLLVHPNRKQTTVRDMLRMGHPTSCLWTLVANGRVFAMVFAPRSPLECQAHLLASPQSTLH